MDRAILLISTLDTKGPETLYLRDRIRDNGGNPIVLDMSMSGKTSEAEITPATVAQAAGADIEEIRVSRERKKITRQMIQGAVKLAQDLLDNDRLAGVIGLGGSTGSLMATDVMRSLRFGLPKLMVSSTAALPGLATRYIGTGDIAVLHTVIEIAGLSRPLENLLDRAGSRYYGNGKRFAVDGGIGSRARQASGSTLHVRPYRTVLPSRPTPVGTTGLPSHRFFRCRSLRSCNGRDDPHQFLRCRGGSDPRRSR